MPLSLITGPPNSGRAGVIRARIEALLDRDPVLVVPTVEDVERFEWELAGEQGVLGPSIKQFDDLFEAIATATGAAVAPPITDAQRLGAVRAAIERSGVVVLAAASRYSGFAPALVELFDEFGAACLDPATVTANSADEGSPYLAEIAGLYSAYAELLAELGLSDPHELARAGTDALRGNPAAWGERPVFLYGFDDLKVEQLEAAVALAAATEVTATVTYEDRDALSARATLREQLRERGGEIDEQLEPNPDYTESKTLYAIERGFLEPDAKPVAPDDDGLRLLETAGSRSQAEQVGIEIEALIESGVEPRNIAVALRNINVDGPTYAAVFEGLGIPVAAQAKVPLAETGTGRALLSLLQALFGTRSAADLLAYLRCPGRSRPNSVDWLERKVRRERIRGADEALAEWNGRDLWEIEKLREAKDSATLLRDLSWLAHGFAEYPDKRQAPRADPLRALELRAGSIAARALAEIAELEPEDGPAAAIAVLEDLDVPLWRGPPGNRVVVSDPYPLRAGRFSHVFVASVQHGEFPRPGRDHAFLSEAQRTALGLPARADEDAEERYRFYVCLSLPTDRLYLCTQTSDEDGGAIARSAFLDDVRELLDPPPPDDADSADELFESLTSRRRLAAFSLEPQPRDQLEAGLAEAKSRLALPGPMAPGAAVDALAKREGIGASTLERYRECSYRWFVDHELDPQALEPTSEALSTGSLAHLALERLYREPPAEGPRPTPTTLAAWRQRATELIAAEAPGFGVAGGDAASTAARVRAESQVLAFLGRDADVSSALMPRPDLIEASFGEGEHDTRELLQIGDLRLHGKIDRVDVIEGNPPRALLRDYKTSREVTTAAKLADEGKLQLQLYTRAISDLWGLEPIGALYEPLGGTKDLRPRGPLRKDDADLFEGLSIVNNDLLTEEEWEATISGAVELAERIGAGMRSGAIDRDPLDGECPPYCTFAPICRRERARPDTEPDEDEEELLG